MSDTRQNIPLPANTWVNLYAEASIAVGTKLNVENTGTCDVFLAVQAAQPPQDHNEYNILKRTGPKMTNHAGDSGAWAYCGNTNGELNVSVKSLDGFSPVLPGTEFDAMIEISDRGTTALGVFIQDQTTQAIDVFFTSKKGDVTTTTVAPQGGHDVDLEPGHGAVIGDVIESRTAENFVQAEIINVVGDTITVATPWSRTFPIGVVVGLASPLLNVLGTLAAPVIFSIDPSALQKIDMTRIILNMIDSSSMDFTTFGSLPALINGCTLRYKQTDGTFINMFNFRDNSELIERSFDHVFQSKVGGGSFGFVARSTWAGQDKRGVAIRIDGAAAEEFQIVVQDDLSSLDKFRSIGQGHIVQQA